jgi:cell division protein ZapB
VAQCPDHPNIGMPTFERLTHLGNRSIVNFMEAETPTQETTRHITALEERLAELIALYEQLGLENQSFRTQQTVLLAERDELLDKNAQAQARIKTMVARLRDLDLPP